MTKKRAGWICAAAVLGLVLASVLIPTEGETVPKAKEPTESLEQSSETEEEADDEKIEKQLESKDVISFAGKWGKEDADEAEIFSYEPKGTLLIEESFSYAADSFGFANASVKDGALRLTENMQPGEVSVKKFDPEIMGQSMVELCFSWKAEFPEEGQKSGLEFRDLYGRLIFAISGGYNENTGNYEFRYSAEGDDNTLAQAIEPKWSSFSYLPGTVYHVYAWVDFISGNVSAVICDEDDTVLARFMEAPTAAGGLSKMAACCYGKTGRSPVQTIDDFRLYVSNDAGSFPLRGKNVIAFGDSIVDGHLYKEAGFVEFLAEQEGMNLEYNYANNGARIMLGNTVNPVDGLGGTILECQVNAAAMENRNPDYVIFDGGANDAYSGILQRLGNVRDTDTGTFAGAFRATVRAIHKAWPNAKIVYVAVHKLSVRDPVTQERLYQLTRSVCEDMGVEVADLYQKGWDSTNVQLNRKYGFDALSAGQIPVSEENSTGAHPNFLAIEEFYVPVVADALKRAGTVTISAEEMQQEIKEPSGDAFADGQELQGISIAFEEDEYQIAAGKTVALEAKVTSSSAAGGELLWSVTKNQKYASITAVGSKCEVSTKKSGAGRSVTILAEAADGSGEKKEVKLQLMKHEVTKVAIKTKKRTLKAGAKLVVKASVRTNGAKANKKLEWTVSDPDYVTLRPDKDGRQCVVMAKAAGVKKTVLLTVQSTDGTDKKAEIMIQIQ